MHHPGDAARPHPAHAEGGLSRPALAQNRTLWAVFAGMFAAFAIGVAGMLVVFEGYPSRPLLLQATCLALVAVVAGCSAPPETGTWRNHVAIASTYVFNLSGLVAFGESALIPLPAAMFVGPFAASRLRSRWQIAAHLAVASASFMILVALGVVGDSATLGIATIVPGMWILGFGVAIVLEAAEAQGLELERLARRDPLTGLGNRRLLTERLTYELERHRRAGRQLSVLALDLNGFKALNDTVGHDAGDRLLREVAAALQTTARAQDTIVRQGGDEFCVLLPETSPKEARDLALTVRAALAAGTVPITTGTGIATFPDDADAGDALLHAADQRLRVDKAGADRESAARPDADMARATPRRPPVVEPSASVTRVTRVDLAANPVTWMATGVVAALYTGVSIVCALLIGGNLGIEIALSATMAVVAVTALRGASPRIGTAANHVLLALVPSLIAVFLVVFPSVPGAVLGAAIFIGPLTAVRLLDRREILAHFVFATIVLAIPIALGAVDQTTAIMLAMVLIGLWGLGVACTAAMEATEAEGDELERLVRRDPLTGLGNRRLLSERLAYEIDRHEATHRPMSVLALDLNGFKALNDTVGHAAGDALLRDVAIALREAVRAQDTVVRQGGDEFCVILPETDAAGTPSIIATIRARLATINAHGHAITTGIGAATFPADAASAAALLKVADDRLRHAKASRRPCPVVA